MAIESVGYDFLRSEFTSSSGADTSVQMRGVDDYLHQAADSANWPRGIKYDPNNDGTYIASLGVHEHWNNAVDKKYTRNLGSGSGIELIEIEQIFPEKVADHGNCPEDFELCQNYPNPFNPSTMINYQLLVNGHVTLKVYDVLGREVRTLVDESKSAGRYEVKFDATNLASGIYFCRVNIQVNDGKTFASTKKMVLMK